jgi:hypothetical protein
VAELGVTDVGGDQEEQDLRDLTERLRRVRSRLHFQLLAFVAICVLGLAVMFAVSIIGKPITARSLSEAAVSVLSLIVAVAAYAFAQTISSCLRRRTWRRLGRVLLILFVATAAYYGVMKRLYAQIDPTNTRLEFFILVILGGVVGVGILMTLGRMLRYALHKKPSSQGHAS